MKYAAPLCLLLCFCLAIVRLATGPVQPAVPAAGLEPANTAEQTPIEPKAKSDKKTEVKQMKMVDAPTSSYEKMKVREFTVYVHKDLIEKEPGLAEDCLDLLDNKILDVKRAFPASVYSKLQSVPIWLELNNPQRRGACYHPSPRWLANNGYNPDKVRSVEFANARDFLRWSKDQPYVLLHELTHAYHHQVLGYDYAPIKEAFKSARDAGIYDKVLRVSGSYDKAYAITNEQEYFAECSEAFFGVNDFYPFVRGELKQHDPKMYELLKKIWK